MELNNVIEPSISEVENQIQEDAVSVKIRNIIFIVYILLLTEGALRKWIFPALSSPLFFVKDPFIIYTYWLCISYRRTPTHPLYYLIIIFCFVFFILMILQSFIYANDITIGIYGWRNYCLYAPFAFIIGKFYREEDIVRIARFSCLTSIPMALLGYIQYKSSPESYINKNVGNGTSEVFTVITGAVRPYGTFSFTSGFTLYVTSLSVFLLYNFFRYKKPFLSRSVFYICIFSFITCLAVSGSRGAYFSISFILIFLILATLFLGNKPQGFKILFSSVILILLSVLIFTYVFEEQWEIIQQRQNIAASNEGSIFKRIFSVFIDTEFLMYADLTMLGSGIGLGSGGGGYIATGSASFVLAENEWARHILEAGIVMGLIYILYRIFVMVYVFKNAIAGLFQSSSPVPLLFAGFILPNLLVGPITGNGVTYAYSWIFLGFSIAINKIYKKY